MQKTKMSELEENLSRMHSLRHEVRVRIHRAGREELVEWQTLEPETIEIDRGHRRPAELRVSLESIIERLSRLRSSLSERNSHAESA
ncbi:hypothetical protein LZC95_07440 [Pendulispora brunnea]|uniref:Uncharacterized protein n=1 Tax=Pendulispora brunnea TaxID=2905690 RepID=A0ABZ2KGJ8_9BACT